MSERSLTRTYDFPGEWSGSGATARTRQSPDSASRWGGCPHRARVHRCRVADVHRRTEGWPLADERIVGHKPRTLTFAQAAALPLTSITAWETLFDRFRLGAESSGTLLVLAAAGGVGSMVIQLARALTGLTVIGTASRPESRQWALDLGAHHVVDHHDLVAAVREVAPGVDYVFSPHTGGMVGAFAEVLRPAGEITAIDEPEGLDLLPLKDKSITFHWEFMFTRSLFQTPDMIAQHDALQRIAELVDAGSLRTTRSAELTPFNAATLRQAHAMVEDGHMTGKVVVTGF